MIYWFPLGSGNLDKYEFKFGGEERYRDYDVYRKSFRRKRRQWEGEVTDRAK